MKSFLFLWVCFIVFVNCRSKDLNNKLSKIIYHLSGCNGSCPIIDLEIDSSQKIYVHRQYFNSKSEFDTVLSGNYAAKLSMEQYKGLLVILNNVGIDNLIMDSTQICCDMPITTLIIYYNGQKRFLKSRITTGPEYNLLVLLKSFGENKTLLRTTEKFHIEE